MKPTNKKAVAWLSSAHLINDIYTGLLNPIMPFISAKIGISMAIAACVISISHICSSLLQPIFGFFADVILKRAFIFWGMVMISIFIPLAPIAPNVHVLIVFTILGSLGSSFLHPQASGLIVRFSKEDFAKNMAIFMSLGTFGFSFGPLLAASITQYLGMEKVPFLSIIGLILAILMFGCVPKISKTDKKPQHMEFINSMTRILKNHELRILIVLSMMKSLLTNCSSILLPFLWKGMGQSPFYIGLALFLFIFFGGIGSLISRKVELKIGTKPVFYISMIGTLPLTLWFLMIYDSHPTFALAVFAANGFVTMLATPIIMVTAQKIIPDLKSVISGFINGFSWGLVAMCMSVIGFIAQNYGIVEVMTVVAFVPALCSILVKKLDIKNE